MRAVEREDEGPDLAGERSVRRRHTPYRKPRPAEQRLGNAVLLTRDGWGHPGYQIPSKCIHQARVRYFVNLVTPPRSTFGEPDEVPFS